MTDFLTTSLPGTGGTIKHDAEDFYVEEIPLYEPCGEGEHLFVTVEKQGLSTYDLLRELSRALNCKERDLGYAGLKDAKAVTRQTVSIPLCKPKDVLKLEIPGVQILSATPHRNKLRPGHLAGNHFRIRIRHPQVASAPRAEAVLKLLTDQGVPNRFGSQRYGSLGNSHRIGRALLREDYALAIEEIIGEPTAINHAGWQQAAESFRSGDIAGAIELLPRHCRPERRLLEMLQAGKTERKCVLAMPKKLLRLYLSAYQSSLFDRLLEMRMDSLNRIWQGDLAYKHINGACFLVTDPEAEQARADNFEISPTAPLFGYKSMLAEEQVGLVEQGLLDEEGLTLDTFRLSGGLSMEGERRPLRIPIQGTSCRSEGDDLIVAFSLPKGSFATTVMAEIMKAEPLA